MLIAALLALQGCATPTDTLPLRPLTAQPTPKPANVERPVTGGIYHTGLAFDPYTGRSKPKRIGDTVKVNIAETLSATQSVTTETSRSNSVATKGPGTSESGLGILGGLLKLDASASGNDAFSGKGSTENASTFKGQLAASVINVLPNGHLLVAGERSVTTTGGQTLLRFSGVVDPKDLAAGNVVQSADVINARFELAGGGEVSEAGSRSWMQRVLTGALRVW